LFLALPFQREDLFIMFLSTLHMKPPKLRIVKTETKAKIRWKGPAR
jgi:hypothetical protein